MFKLPFAWSDFFKIWKKWPNDWNDQNDQNVEHVEHVFAGQNIDNNQS